MSKIYSIGGGKGGVGKTFITANLGTVLAKQGKKVLLIDLDLGGSNLHTILGVKNVEKCLSLFLNKSVKKLDKVAIPTPVSNLFVISSSHCSMEIPNLVYAQKLKIINAIKKLSYDYILIDLGSGTNFNTLDFFLTSNEGIFVCVPEPTSIENAFRFIKAAYLRKLKQIIKTHKFNKIVRQAAEKSGQDNLGSRELMEVAICNDPKNRELLEDSLKNWNIGFILNEFRKNTDSLLGGKMEKVCNRHFYSKFKFLGKLGYDERVVNSIVSKTIYVNKYPYSQTAEDIKKAAEKLK
jgi:flagellar biosynthesis protein FlhG